MPKHSIIIFAFATVGLCHLAQADTDLANRYVREYISNGAPHIIEKCLGESWPLNCQNGHFLMSGEKMTFIDNNSGKMLSYQEFWYEGMELSYRAGEIVSLSVFSSNWPTYLGLGIGSTRKRIVGLLNN